VKVAPQLLGGGHEHGMRSSTENIPGIAGLARAAAIGQKDMDKKAEKLSGLRNRIRDNILDNIEGVRHNGHPEKRLPGNCNMSFDYIEGEAIVLRLDTAGIAVSSGSACSSSSLKPSHVLIAMGLTPEEAHGSLRITLGFENTVDEVNYFLEVLPGIISDLRNISPLYNR
jgi:cysteine desulfurase